LGRKFTLYWSSLTNYENCPQAFLWGRGWGDIDVGGGPGRRKPRPEQRSRHHAVMGIALQAGIEGMYKNEWYRKPQEMAKLMVDEATRCYNQEVANSYIDWRAAPSRTDMLNIVLSGVCGYIKTMKEHKLLGPWAKAEFDLVGFINPENPIGGRADTVFRRDDTGVTIIDGKNSGRYLDKKTGTYFSYTDPDQLRWYALCYLLAFNKMVDRLAFVYYRYPFGYVGPEGYEETPSTGMNENMFDPNPSPQGCKFCDYDSVCEARQAQKAANRRTRKPKKSYVPDGAGIIDLDLG